ncbi:STAS domain-containing protein [Prauserella cavernicola]|uniref:Anti-sigma factor antagonist n=1 Tax=Prauserella cavernicola TaxID=2800127 RepID=A0A934V5A7_9PSEU|nr:STAS domain-containing protein [Prauserella cavernicola]MBK1786282.1 STAS domain-containing protein [Prauserella cavernicola]
MPELLGITDDRRGTTLVVRVTGDVDLASSATLERHLTDVVTTAHPPEPLVLDLSAVGFLGSCGLSLLLRLHQAAESRGTHLRIVAGHRAVTRPVELLGLQHTLRLHPTVEAALALTY